MRKKGIQNTLVAGIILIMILVGITYTMLLTGPGIEVSCEDLTISGYKKVPPPLMAIVPPPTRCQVEISATTDGEVICSGKIKIYSKMGVFPCDELKSNLNKIVHIEAVFFDVEDQRIGTDTKSLEYKGV